MKNVQVLASYAIGALARGLEVMDNRGRYSDIIPTEVINIFEFSK